MNRTMQTVHTDPLPTIWPAARLGQPLHANYERPHPRFFVQPSMTRRDHRRLAASLLVGGRRDNQRLLNQPAAGGLWSFALGSAVSPELFVAIFRRTCPELYLHRDFWLLTPEPDTQVVVIDGPDDLAAALDRWPYVTEGARGDRAEIDYCAVLADGFAGVHLTKAGYDAGLPLMRAWEPDATCWLRWAFVGPPRKVPETTLSYSQLVARDQAAYEARYGEAIAGAGRGGE